MSIDEFKTILSKIKDYTNYIYLHVKGEPLLHPNIIEFINLANDYNLKVNLTTNGVLLNKYYKELTKLPNLNKINISLHCKQDIKDYFDNVFKSVDEISKNQTIVYRIWTLDNGMLDRENESILNNLKKYYNLSEEKITEIYNKNNINIRSNIYLDKENIFKWPSINEYKSEGYCYALKTQIAVLCDGTVVPCCLDSDAKVVLGNIFEKDLYDIINSEKYQKLKKSFQDRKPCEELCKSCEFKERLI